MTFFLKGKGYRVRQAWVQTPALAVLTIYISLGKSLNMSGLNFFISKMGIISIHL